MGGFRLANAIHKFRKLYKPAINQIF